MTFKQYIIESEELFGLSYHPALIPPDDIEDCKKIMIQTNKDKWADDKGNFTVSTKDEIEKIIKQKNGEAILRHETVHALQKEKAPYLFKGSNKLGKDITKDKKKYISLPSEIMAFALSNVLGDKKYEALYKEIGGNVYKLYLKYIDEYKNQIKELSI